MDLRALPPEPLVSVLMANYNYGRFIADAATSLIAQTYRNWELCMCDDGSTDRSRDVMEQLSEQDDRIRVAFKANGGQASAWNHAFQHASGDIVVLLDADDLFRPRKLEKVIAAFRDHPSTGLVYHRFQPIRQSGRLVGAPFPRSLECGWLAEAAIGRGGWGPEGIASVLALHRDFADAVFPLPVTVGGFGDAFTLGIAQFLTSIWSLPEALTLYRIHDANDSGSLTPHLRDVEKQAAARSRIHQQIREFIAERFGTDIAERLSLADIPSYWEYLCALYVLAGKPRRGVHSYSGDQLLAGLRNPRRRRIWQLLFILPPAAGQKILQLWWSKGWWKRYMRLFTRLLRLE